MKVTDLRIGNIVKTKYGLLSVHASMLVDITNNGFKVKGEKLTPDILDKAKFKPYLDTTGINFHPAYRRYKVGIEMRNKKTFTIIWFDANDDRGVVLYVPFRYVHQLQNIYFVLTGEELDLTL